MKEWLEQPLDWEEIMKGHGRVEEWGYGLFLVTRNGGLSGRTEVVWNSVVWVDRAEAKVGLRTFG